VASGDVVKPLPPVGGSQPSPCHPRYELALREIAFCND